MNFTSIKISGQENYFYQEALKVLRTNILFCGDGVKVITITSCDMNEGKTTTSINMASSLAELGKRVLIIDADMRKSVMAGRYADAKNAKGLSEVLSNQNRLENCIYETQIDNLHVLFAGQYPPNPVELLNGKQFDMLIEAVKEEYDYVIVDAPPLGMVIDAAVIAAKCDSAIMVIGNDHVKRAQAQEVKDQLKKSGCNLLGVILNNTDNQKKAYYKNEKYQYKPKH